MVEVNKSAGEGKVLRDQVAMHLVAMVKIMILKMWSRLDFQSP